MSAKLPPVPPDNRSHKGVGDKAHPTAGEAAAKGKVEKPDQQGQQGNIRQSTTHHGHQQDR